MSATDLDDREGIRRLLAIYGQLLDDRRVEEWGELFTEDATFLVWGNTSAGRAAIVADIGGMQPPDAALRHLVTSTVIDLRGDGTARVWADFMVAMRVGDELTVAAVGRYYDRVVRDGDRWRFASRVIVPLGDEVPEGVELPPPH